jgi:hypothetical protein
MTRTNGVPSPHTMAWVSQVWITWLVAFGKILAEHDPLR